MRNRGSDNKSIRIEGVAGKQLTGLAAAVAPKGLKPMDVQKKITESLVGIPDGYPIVIKVDVKKGNVFTVTVRPGPTIKLLKHLQPDYQTQVKASTVSAISQLYIKHNVSNTTDEQDSYNTICHILHKSCKLQVEGFGGSDE